MKDLEEFVVIGLLCLTLVCVIGFTIGLLIRVTRVVAGL